MQKVSIIVPVYNVEGYLPKCIDSILAQTFTDFELIIVDDGSTDSCGAICDEYANKDNRIKVIHKKNGGLSSARNAGIDIAKGDFFIFVDSDDYVHPEMCSLLFENLLKYNADIVACGCYIVKNDKIIKEIKASDEGAVTLDSISAISRLFKGELLPAWGKIYKRECFLNLRFPFGKIDEDFAVMYKLFYNCKKIVCIEDLLNFYVIRDKSILRFPFNEATFDFFDNAVSAVNFVKENNLPLLEQAESYLYLRSYGTIYVLLKSKQDKNFKKRYQEITSIFKHKFFSILKNKYLDKKSKIEILGYAISPKLTILLKTLFINVKKICKGKGTFCFT
jgi:glycosyltransferase involved in cell wall biosynthesis